MRSRIMGGAVPLAGPVPPAAMWTGEKPLSRRRLRGDRALVAPRACFFHARQASADAALHRTGRTCA